jgi:hypothetical protein
MRPCRTSAALIPALLASLVAPLAAQAGPLLSGYGGPGEGSQAIVGVTLVNGSSGGGGNAAGGTPSRPDAAAAFRRTESSNRAGRTSSSRATTGAGGAGRAATNRSGARKGTSSGGQAGGVGATVGASRAASRPGGSSSASEGVATPASESETLGLTGRDFLYVLLVLGALVLVGVLTGRLAGEERGRPA